MRRLALYGAALGLSLLACGDAGDDPAARAPESDPPAASESAPIPLANVGSEECSECHAEETRRWRDSHHDRAMELPSETSVEGDFSGSSLVHEGERFEFLRAGERFVIRTAGPDGETRDFEVAYTFGVEPLQQYLVRLPGGRLHAVGVAWDTRPAEQGGQRWYHLQPDQPVPPNDPLHWSGNAGSWGVMCADCHSTQVDAGYRAALDRYEPSWSELDVACEACHGAGSRHVAWARAGADPESAARRLPAPLGTERSWRFAPGEVIAQRDPMEPHRGEVETCAPCHSRRSRIVREARVEAPFLDGYRPALLESGLYHADGQILEEVYVWGSFVQSRMYAAGVTCSDCHDPHSLRIEAPDAACASCHQSAAFASESHHGHANDSPGASCVACHMPATTYMGVDARRDHGFRVPRPDLSASIGVPNACAGCHADRSDEWASDAIAEWRGGNFATDPHFATVLDAGRRGAPGAPAQLAALSRDASQPAIARATALQLLARQLDAASIPSIEAALRDEDPLVRMAAVEATEALDAQNRWRLLERAVADERRAVRIEAGRALAGVRNQLSDPQALRSIDRAIGEYRASQRVAADRPESHVNLALLHTQLGELDGAEREYRLAIERGSYFIPAYLNLAELLRRSGREPEGAELLRDALAIAPDHADIHHALGLSLVRAGRIDPALASLERAATLAPEAPRYAYVYGVALHSAARVPEAMKVLEAAAERHPGSTQLQSALATFYRDAGETERALVPARKLLALRPDDPGVQALVRDLEEREGR